MSSKLRIFTAAAIAALATAGTAHAQGNGQLPIVGSQLSGDTKLACEAILCLSTGQRPSECTPPIQRYFSIHHKKSWETLQARLNFLQLCPASNQQGMPSLINAIANGAGMCSAPTINLINRDYTRSWGDEEGKRTISNTMPQVCATYFNHPWTNLKDSAPRYVGTPATGGYWVEAADYARAQAQYKARMEAEAKRRKWEQRWNDGN